MNSAQPNCTVFLRLQYTVTHSHSLTDSPRTTSSPASSVHGKSPVEAYHFYLLHHTLSVFRYANVYHCVTIAYSSRFSNMLYRLLV